MGKTAENHYTEYYEQGKKELDTKYTQRQANTKEALNEQYSIIDSNVNNAKQKMQQQIDQQPRKYAEQLAISAFNEELGRQQVAERMANMGLTDSGLSASSLVALGAQRGRTDANALQSMKDYVRKLETAIDDMTLKAKNEKKTLALDATQDDQEWYDRMEEQLRTDADTYATTMVKADTDAAALAEVAKTISQQSNSTGISQNTDSATYGTYVRPYMPPYAPKSAYEIAYDEGKEFGYTNDENALYAKNGGGDAGHQAVAEAAMQDAGDWVKRAKLDMDIAGWGTLFGNQDSDGKKVADSIKAQLKGTDFQSLSKAVKSAVLAVAVAEMVSTTWDKERDWKDNEARITKACEELGADKLVALELCGYSV